MPTEYEVAFDQILEKVTNHDTLLDSVRELITDLRRLQKEAVDQLGKLTPTEKAKLDGIFAAALKVDSEIAEALLENTPEGEPTEPPAEPPAEPEPPVVP